MNRGKVSPVDFAMTAAQACRDDGGSFFATTVVLDSSNGPAEEVTDLVNAMHGDGWAVQSVTALSQYSVLIVFRSTVDTFVR